MNSQTLRYTPEGSIELFETETPDPGPGEVQVAGLACGICSWDIATCKQGTAMPVPAPPGHEGVGRVVKTGADVTQLKEGDLIAGGGFATVSNRPEATVYRLPDSKIPPHLWMVEPVSCCVTGLDHMRIMPGHRVAVIGCGFMGLILIQLLGHSPCSEVVAIDLVEERLTLATKFGATVTHNSGEMSPEAIAEKWKERRFDVVCDTSGVQAGLDLAAKLTKKGGQINLFGWMKGSTATFNPTQWHLGGFTVVNSSPSSRLRDPFPPAIDLIANGVVDLSPLVTHTVPLPEYPDLMQRILGGEPGYIKGVVLLNEDSPINL